MKTRGIIWSIAFFLSTNFLLGAIPPQDSMKIYFQQVETATAKYAWLWDKNIYGPILIVDPVTRKVFANCPDKEGFLQGDSGLYRGILPLDVPYANTDVEWKGVHWAMVRLPLPADEKERTDLITHELFHVAQPSLGFRLLRQENNHLDLREGRVCLRLELAALEAALKAARYHRSVEHLKNALIFRKYRHILYRGSESTENYLELLEGMATYTGQIMSGRDKWQWREHLIQRMETYNQTSTFVRSFAYETVPVYGFFLYQTDNHWNKKISGDTQLTDFFSEAFDENRRILLQSYVKQVADEYGGRYIVDEEIRRGLSNDALVELYREKFFEEPHLEIRLEDMDMSFDPQSLIPLGPDEGTVYPFITVGDKWGVLTVERGGALLRDDWRWLIVSPPIQQDGLQITGDGWTLRLNEDYEITHNAQGDYQVVRKNSPQSPRR